MISYIRLDYSQTAINFFQFAPRGLMTSQGSLTEGGKRSINLFPEVKNRSLPTEVIH